VFTPAPHPATGATPLIYQWRFISRTCWVKTAMKGHIGIYKPEMKNNLTRLAQFIVLFVLARGSNSAAQPLIALPPQNQTNFVGAVTIFSVEPPAPPPLTTKRTTNAPAPPAAASTQLVVSNAQLSDLGSYRVVVTNAEGSVTSAPAQLYVFPTFVPASPQELLTVPGDSQV